MIQLTELEQEEIAVKIDPTKYDKFIIYGLLLMEFVPILGVPSDSRSLQVNGELTTQAIARNGGKYPKYDAFSDVVDLVNMMKNGTTVKNTIKMAGITISYRLSPTLDEHFMLLIRMKQS